MASKRSTTATRTTVTVLPLVPLDRREVEAAFERYAHFVGTPVQVRWG